MNVLFQNRMSENKWLRWQDKNWVLNDKMIINLAYFHLYYWFYEQEIKSNFIFSMHLLVLLCLFKDNYDIKNIINTQNSWFQYYFFILRNHLPLSESYENPFFSYFFFFSNDFLHFYIPVLRVSSFLFDLELSWHILFNYWE